MTRARLLIVDDMPILRKVHSRHFIARGHDVEVAADGEETLRTLRERDFDLVLLDLSMPGMDGLEVLDRMKADGLLDRTAVIVFSGTDDSETIAAALGRGAQDFVIKPADWNVLDARVDVALRLKRGRDEMRDQNAELSQLALTDPLTGLPNRRSGEAAIAAALRAPDRSRTRLLKVDVDHFKLINDRLGHPVGDEVLRRIATVLASRVRSTDIVARWGGDEFIVVLHGVGTDADALGAADQLRRHVAADDELAAVGGVSVSIGIARGSEANADAIVAAADRAMYSAKDAGRDEVRLSEPGAAA